MVSPSIFRVEVQYFAEPVRRVKIQTSKNSQRYYTTKRLVRDLLSNTPNCCPSGYLITGMRDGTVGSRTELAREMQLTDWSTTGNLSGPLEHKYGGYLYSFRALFVLYEVQLDNNRSFYFGFRF